MIYRNILFVTIYISRSKIKHRSLCRLLRLLQPRQYKLFKNIHTHFQVQIKLLQLILLHQHHHILLSIYLPTFSCTYNFHNLNTHQHCMIYHIHIFNEVVLNKLDINSNPVESTFLINANSFIRRFATSVFRYVRNILYFFSSNTYEYI